MRTAFVDSSYLLALANLGDEHHSNAIALEQTYRGRLLSTEYVPLEVLDALTTGANRLIAADMVASIRRDPNAQVIAASTDLFEAGLVLFGQRLDQDWGITDCISFVVMRKHGLTEALPADHHYEQAGFRALLRSSAEPA